MKRRAKFTLLYAPEVYEHLDAIDAKYYRLIEETLHEQLSYTPEVVTRNRKLLEAPAPFAATWELRFGSNNVFRAFYEVDTTTHNVTILAIGIKKGNRLWFGRTEFEL